MRSGGESAADEIQSQHDASERLSAEPLPRSGNGRVGHFVFRKTRHRAALRRKPEWLRGQNGFAKYSDEKREPDRGWCRGCGVRRGAESGSCPQHSSRRSARISGERISRDGWKRNLREKTPRIL